MSGRRLLLDLITVVNASRKVAAKHAARQGQHLDIRARTSSLTKEFKHQTDRVSGAVQAASDLARKLNESDHETSDRGDSLKSSDRGDVAAGKEEIKRESAETVSADTTQQPTYERSSDGGTPKSTERPFGSASNPSFEPGRDETNTYHEEPSEEVVGQLFRSRRVANSLFGQRSPGSDRASENGETHITPRRRGNNAPIGAGILYDTQSTGATSQPVPGSSVKVLVEEGSQKGSLHEETVVGDSVPQSSETGSSTTAQQGEEPYQMLESRVPLSRLGRLWEYGGLATSMAFGVVGESIRRSRGADDSASGSLMLGPGNIERLVNKLSKMRGAALKLGQMMSFQDPKMLPPTIREVLQRVQDRANYMPAFQRDKVMSDNLGSNWRDLFESFEEIPMAAASIGQVHSAVLKDTGQRVAVKVQYPGVADSIDSDLNNLAILLTASRLLPKGLYLDKTIANARTELGWECDYIREAECGRYYKQLLADETSTFDVPDIIADASGAQVLTMEHMDGIAVTKLGSSSTQSQRDWIGTQILRLCLREICEFRYMQTDPNWTNFLYNSATGRLELLDFGASRAYPPSFIDTYVRVLMAASRNDRQTCRDLSVELGYLTGYESQAMTDAHVSSILVLAEPFMMTAPDVYDFSDQTITERVRDLIPLMLRERLAPPPEETYSLHRKLSGAFLLCARLGSRVRCRELFEDAVREVDLLAGDRSNVSGVGVDAKAAA